MKKERLNGRGETDKNGRDQRFCMSDARLESSIEMTMNLT